MIDLHVDRELISTANRTFVVSYILMFLINLIPGCKFRVDEEGEIIGVDEVEVSRHPALTSRFNADGSSSHPAARRVGLRLQ